MLIGCAEAPPNAPKDFQELTAFIYEHMNDEDPEELTLGVENMFDWLNRNSGPIRKGYTVRRLTPEAIASTGKHSKPKDLIGGAALTAHSHSLDMLARALSVDNVAETNGNAYIKFRREFLDDPECFAQRECATTTCNSYSTSEWAGGLIEVKYDTRVEFRWINTRIGPVMLHRSFMNKKPEVSVSFPGADLRQSYYLGIVFPPLQPIQGDELIEEDQAPDEASPSEMSDQMSNQGEGTDDAEEDFNAETLDLEIDEVVIPSGNDWGASAFLQVNWLDVSYGILPVSEDRALEMLVEGLIGIAVSTEKWMNKTYTE